MAVKEHEQSVPSSAVVMPPNRKSKTNSGKSMKFRTRVYEAIVEFIAELLADILTHPKLWDHVVNLVVTAINAFMEQEDIGSKLDKTARNVIYDAEKARETSKALGKEVVPMVTGFVGGVASSLKPSVLKRRKQKRLESKSIRMAETTVSEITLSDRLVDQEGVFDGE